MDDGLRRGVSFGNAFEAPSDHPWPLALSTRHTDEVKRAGFDTVRIPVRWSAHAGDAAPYTVDPAFAGRVDRAVDEALDRGLNVVLNVHHYDELSDDPDGHQERFLALWRQIAPRYADRPDRLLFELLNEPRDPMTAQRWNHILARALAVVRESNPGRRVIIGPTRFNNLEGLVGLDLPADDRVMATIHYYSPFPFTHQGATWLEGTDEWLGTTWGTHADQEAVRSDLTAAADWARERGLALFLGEFGTYWKADMPSRARWTRCVRSEAERLGVGWAYWEFGTDFGAFDLERESWHEPLRQALLGDG